MNRLNQVVFESFSGRQAVEHKLRSPRTSLGFIFPLYLVGSTFQIVHFANASRVSARNVAMNSKLHLYPKTLALRRLDRQGNL